jgi:hypothetical protein
MYINNIKIRFKNRNKEEEKNKIDTIGIKKIEIIKEGVIIGEIIERKE